MTQDSHPAVLPTESADVTAVPLTVGQALQTLRLAKGWSLDEVSSRIKFSARQISALENEQWDRLPTGVSLRGLITNYARLLGADAPAIIASLDSRIVAPGAAPLRMTRTPIQTSRDDERGGGSWGWFLVLLVLLAAGVAYAFWQDWLPQQWLSLVGLARLAPVL